MAAKMIPTTMRIPQFIGQGQVTFGEKPVPTPQGGELLIEVKANALCGSERPQFYAGSAVTPGHEAAGIVVAAGPGTTTPIGTPGIIFLMDYCGQCRSCHHGYTNQCLEKRGDMGFNRDGGYGPYELVHENIFFPVDADLPLTEATLLLDVMGTSGHGIRRAKLVRPDIESVLVLGAGPVGLGMVAMSRLGFGDAVPIYVTDVAPDRLRFAEHLGAQPIDLTKGSLAEGLHNYGVSDVDIAFDTSGKEAARRSGMDALGKRGALICIGHGEGLTVNVSNDLIAPERAILGSEYFAFAELPQNLLLLREHRDYLAQIITHRFPVAEIQQAFALFLSGKTGKVIIEQ